RKGVSWGGGTVAGTLSISGDHTSMMRLPNSPLLANTVYTVAVSGVQDVSGNVAPPFSSSFTTGSVAAGIRPSVTGISPVSNATAPPTTAVTLTFNTPVDATSVNSTNVPVRINNNTLVSGNYTVNGNVAVIVPSQTFPVETLITVTVNSFGFLDYAGNGTNSFQSSFTTGLGTVSVSPANATLGAGQTQPFAATVTNSFDPSVTWSIPPA